MGQSRRRKEAFFAGHPVCAFCGGTRAAETVEHCPPRALFQNRAWPEGYEFPSCVNCNAGSSNDDLIIAFLARMDPFEDLGNQDGKLPGLIKQFQRQFPELLQQMVPSPAEARKINRSVGISPEPGQTHQDAGPVKVLPAMDLAVKRFGGKLSKAIYYKATGKPFPLAGEIAAHWFTNADLLQHGYFPAFRALQELGGILPEHVRSTRLLTDQFGLKWSLSDDAAVFVLQAMFGKSFGIVTFGSINPGVISSQLESLQAEHPRDNFSLVPALV